DSQNEATKQIDRHRGLAIGKRAVQPRKENFGSQQQHVGEGLRCGNWGIATRWRTFAMQAACHKLKLTATVGIVVAGIIHHPGRLPVSCGVRSVLAFGSTPSSDGGTSSV